MHPNARLIETFYTAFQRRDHAAMAACYHPDIHFSDPVFTDLRGFRAGAMWRMLCERGKDLELTFSDVQADDRRGSAGWVARYTFSQTGRRVVNVISAEFEFEGGRIIRHRDSFPLWRWSSQALGPVGMLLGWAPPLQGKIRAQSARTLEAFIAKNGLG